MRRKMQGSGREEYSTYEQDVSELEARHKKVDVSTKCLTTPTDCQPLCQGCEDESYEHADRWPVNISRGMLC